MDVLWSARRTLPGRTRFRGEASADRADQPRPRDPHPCPSRQGGGDLSPRLGLRGSREASLPPDGALLGSLRFLRVALPTLEQRDAVLELVLQRALQARLEEGQDSGLLGPQVRQVLAQLGFDLALDLEEQLAFGIGRQHLRMDVAFTADGRRVAEARGDALDRRLYVLLERRLGVEVLELLQRHGGKHSALPGAEVLRRDVAAGD